MPIADTKKVQTMINIVGQEMVAVRESMSRMEAVRTRYNAHSPSTVGTPLDGNLTAVNNAMDALKAEVDKAVWTQMIAAIVSSHKNKALD